MKKERMLNLAFALGESIYALLMEYVYNDGLLTAVGVALAAWFLGGWFEMACKGRRYEAMLELIEAQRALIDLAAEIIRPNQQKNN